MLNFSGLKAKLIYVFRINDDAHAGCLKIGEATFDHFEVSLPPNSPSLNEAAKARIDQYTKTAGIDYELLHTEIAVVVRNKQIGAINDKEVHQVLLRSGISRKDFGTGGSEWFICDLATAINAICAAKEGRSSLSSEQITAELSPIAFRPEQRQAIDKTLKQFAKGRNMLWNAKMRFGKTLSALQVIKEHGKFRRVLILTHRPVVDSGWYEDFHKIFYDTPNISYGSKTHGERFANLEERCCNQSQHYIYFASMQDLRGSNKVGGNFDKNNEVFTAHWDLIIVDEAHEGTQTQLGKSVLKTLVKKSTKVLELSGTPFNIISNHSEEEVYTWDYTMEQRAKLEWDASHPGDHNPYSGLPTMHILTYNLGKLFSKYANNREYVFNFREFFRTHPDTGRFVHHADVQSFLDLLTKTDEKSMYPFANDTYRGIFRHTLWMVPGVKSAQALSAVLKEHPVFGHFEIVNVAGDGDEEAPNEEALKMVTDAIGPDPDATRTITLSCGRLTTGVSVKAWTGVFMLSGSQNTAASNYMQTIFRVQTPATINGRVKQDCYVFDFAPDRTLKVIASSLNMSTKAGKQTQAQRQLLAETLKYISIIAVDGSEMFAIDADTMLQHIKRACIERVVNNGFEDNYLYNDKLLNLSDIDLKKFDKLHGIIGDTSPADSVGDIVLNKQGFSGEQLNASASKSESKPKPALTEAEKEAQAELKRKAKIRANAISLLRAISIRMPLLIYGAEIVDEDSELTIDNFTQLVDAESWREFMPSNVTKAIFNDFKEYYDPDVFTASAKSVREKAREADNFSIEERIARITDIFKTFRNPDKETVLTPWRVVNMHMSDTIGGYTFEDRDVSSDAEPNLEPRFVDRGEVTAEVFAPDSRVLEINSKSGLYPLYLAYNFYRSRMSNALVQPSSVAGHQAIWDAAVAENVFVVCKTPMAKSITRRTLLGFRDGHANLWAPKDLINRIKKQPDSFIKDVKKFVGKNVEIKAVVGNPPYQEVVAKKQTANGQKASASIFHYFQKLSDKIGQYTCLIYPGARWIHRSGKGMEKFGLAQINDTHLSLLKFFPVSTDIFKEVGIADGISIVLKDNKKTNPGFLYCYSRNGIESSMWVENLGENLLPLNPFSSRIVAQLDLLVEKYDSLHNSIYPRSIFSIESDFVEKHPTIVREYNNEDTFNPNYEIKLFTNDKAGKSGRARWYVIDKEVIKTGKCFIDKWKVVVSSANAGGQKRSNQIAILDNHSVFGRSRVALKMFDSEREAQNFLKYATSEVIRFAFLLTDEALTSLAKKVPDILNYKDDNGIIDFDKDIDSQLYNLLNISETDQVFIKRTLAEKAK